MKIFHSTVVFQLLSICWCALICWERKQRKSIMENILVPKTGKLGRRRKLSKWEEFIMVFLRLWLGLLERDLAHRFRVSVSTVSVVLRCWVKFTRAELHPLCIHWPSKEQIRSFMPQQFQKLCPELVSIIDGTEIRMESPWSFDNKAACYSSYKSHSTMKALVGIMPNGMCHLWVSFILVQLVTLQI